MIICSCNVLSGREIRPALATATRRPRVSQVYAHLGSRGQCGRCAGTIKKLIDDPGVLTLVADLEDHLADGVRESVFERGSQWSARSTL